MAKEPSNVQKTLRGQACICRTASFFFLLILLVLPYSMNKFATRFTFCVSALERRALQLEA